MSGDVSVIIPNRDMGRFLDDTFRSIERQAPHVAQVILADAGSTDESLEVAARWRGRGFQLDVTVTPGANPAQARNAGLARATAPLITFLDADDLFPAGKLKLQKERLAASPAVDVVSGRVTLFETLDEHALAPVPGTRTETVVGPSAAACLLRREVFDRIGTFDEDLLYAEDIDFILRLLEARVPLTVMREEVLYYRRHPDSLMSQSDSRGRKDFHRALARSIRRRAAAGITGNLPALADFLAPDAWSGE